ncbi:GIY-YIG nuclease family protein [Synechococcus sp. AH-551-N17]|nr:GIY-YIG nuclease family protein [Synechococcus sp. AH-551-N17]
MDPEKIKENMRRLSNFGEDPKKREPSVPKPLWTPHTADWEIKIARDKREIEVERRAMELERERREIAEEKRRADNKATNKVNDEKFRAEKAAFKEQMMNKLIAKQEAREKEKQEQDAIDKERKEQEALSVLSEQSFGFVYFVRNGDLCKIGITENLLRRMDQLKPDEVLNVVRCSNYEELERTLHKRFRDVRLPQTEYFRLSDEQVQKVHRLIVDLAEF